MLGRSKLLKKKKRFQLFGPKKYCLDCISIMYLNQMITSVFCFLKSSDACPRGNTFRPQRCHSRPSQAGDIREQWGLHCLEIIFPI